MDVGQEYHNTSGTIAPKVDTRANGGYVMCVGSLVNGRPHTFLTGYELDSSPDKWNTLPQWVLDALNERKPSVKASSADEGACEGGRNDYLTRFGGGLRRIGCTEGEILAAMLARNASRCNTPLPEDEVRQITRHLLNYDPDQISEMLIEGVEPSNRANVAADQQVALHLSAKLRSPTD